MFDETRASVEAMVEAGEPLVELEGQIDEVSLPEEEKAALWLVAWSLSDRRMRRALPAGVESAR